MTIRAYLNRKLRRAWIVIYGSFGSIAVGALLFRSGSTLLFVGMCVAILGFVVGILSMHSVRCPRCNNYVAHLPNAPKAGYFKFSKNLRFCAFCGVELDSEMQDG